MGGFLYSTVTWKHTGYIDPSKIHTSTKGIVRGKVSNSTGDQNVTGLGCTAISIKKNSVKSTSKEHYYDSKFRINVGVTISGQTLGWVHTCTDGVKVNDVGGSFFYQGK